MMPLPPLDVASENNRRSELMQRLINTNHALSLLDCADEVVVCPSASFFDSFDDADDEDEEEAEEEEEEGRAGPWCSENRAKIEAD